MTTKHVFAFSEGDKDQKDLLGGKGANLAELAGMKRELILIDPDFGFGKTLT